MIILISFFFFCVNNRFRKSFLRDIREQKGFTKKPKPNKFREKNLRGVTFSKSFFFFFSKFLGLIFSKKCLLSFQVSTEINLSKLIKIFQEKQDKYFGFKKRKKKVHFKV